MTLSIFYGEPLPSIHMVATIQKHRMIGQFLLPYRSTRNFIVGCGTKTLATRELGRVAYHRTMYCLLQLESTVGTVVDKYVDVEQADDRREERKRKKVDSLQCVLYPTSQRVGRDVQFLLSTRVYIQHECVCEVCRPLATVVCCYCTYATMVPYYVVLCCQSGLTL